MICFNVLIIRINSFAVMKFRGSQPVIVFETKFQLFGIIGHYQEYAPRNYVSAKGLDVDRNFRFLSKIK